MKASLRGRLTLTTAAIAGGGLVAAAWLVPQLTERALAAQLRHDAEREAGLVLALVDRPGTIAVPPASGGRLVQVRDGDGRIVAASDGAVFVSGDGAEIQVVSAAPDLTSGWVTGEFEPALLGEDWYVAEASRRTWTGGSVHAYVAAPLAGLQQAVQTVTVVMVVLVPALLAAIVALTWWNVSRTLRPVERIRREAATALDHDESVTFEVPATDAELAGLVETFNAVITRLNASLERQRRLVADASHELLTPLASIRTNLEVALRRPDPDWAHIARRCLAIEGRLADVAQNLLTLGSHDLSSRQTRATRFDLTTLAEEEAMAHSRPILVRGSGPVFVDGDRRALGQLVHNFVANAARHATSTVSISMEVSDEEVRLIVDDDGPGVPVGDRTRIFEPFVRLDRDRSRAAGGAGLGLAIAAAIAADHAASIHVTDAPLGGARFELRLPAGASPQDHVPRELSGDAQQGR